MYRYLIGILIFIFLMTNNVKYFFHMLIAIPIFSLGKGLQISCPLKKKFS